eukprot:scaffold6069_cov63-Attheya_sp.AAC.1
MGPLDDSSPSVGVCQDLLSHYSEASTRFPDAGGQCANTISPQQSFLSDEHGHQAVAFGRCCYTAATDFEISTPILNSVCVSDAHLCCPQSGVITFCFRHVRASFVLTGVFSWCNLVHLIEKCLNETVETELSFEEVLAQMTMP